MRKTLMLACSSLLIMSACKKNAADLLKTDGTLAVSTLAVPGIYVNGTSGNDSNAGTSASAPLKTIQAALYKTSEGAGATIFVAGGTYHERLWWPYSGASATEPITLTNYNGGTVILDGVSATNNSQNEMISVPNRSHIRISNISIANNIRNFASGIYIQGAGTDVQVTYCKIYNIGFTTDSLTGPSTPEQNANPLIVKGSAATSYNNVYIGNNQIYACNTGYSEGLTMAGNVENFLIEYNVVHHIRNIGIDCSGHFSWTGAPDSVNQARNGNVKYNIVYKCISPVALNGGIYVDGGKYINIEGNTVFQNWAGISVGCENNNYTATGVNVRDNFIYNNRNAGILIGSNQPNSLVTYSTVTNNTLYHNFTDNIYGGEIDIQKTDYLSIKNNIVYSASDVVVIALSGYVSTNLAMDYNRYYSLSGANSTWDWGGINQQGYYSLASFQSATGLDLHSTYGNPGLVSGTNLHLANTSACVNAGDPAFVTGYQEYDYDKQTRVQNNRVDIGADETSY